MLRLLIGALASGCAASRTVAPPLNMASTVTPRSGRLPAIVAKTGADNAASSISRDVTTTEAAIVKGQVNALTVSALEDIASVRDGRVGDTALVLERAQLLLRLAMELDPEDASTINGLALRQLEVARRAGNVMVTPMLASYQSNVPAASRQGLDLAHRVLAFGLARFPDDARLHNTSGLVDVELGSYREALFHFDKARQISKDFEAAHFNYASLASELRDYADAERGYREVLRIAPKCYEAKLGLALAKGLALPPEPSEVRLLEVVELLSEAKRLEPTRPEAYFNAAVFMSDILARRTPDVRQVLRYVDDSLCLFEQFLMRADPNRHKEAIGSARARREAMTTTLKFLPNGSEQPHDCARPVL